MSEESRRITMLAAGGC